MGRSFHVSCQFTIRRLHGSSSEGAGYPGPCELAHCERGTCGPGVGGGDCCSCWRNVSSTPPLGPSGAPGVCCCGGLAVFWMMECGFRSQPASAESTRLVTKKVAARIAVVRVRTLAVPQLDINP